MGGKYFNRGNVRLRRDEADDLVADFVKPGEGTHVVHFATCSALH